MEFEGKQEIVPDPKYTTLSLYKSRNGRYGIRFTPEGRLGQVKDLVRMLADNEKLLDLPFPPDTIQVALDEIRAPLDYFFADGGLLLSSGEIYSWDEATSRLLTPLQKTITERNGFMTLSIQAFEKEVGPLLDTPHEYPADVVPTEGDEGEQDNEFSPAAVFRILRDDEEDTAEETSKRAFLCAVPPWFASYLDIPRVTMMYTNDRRMQHVVRSTFDMPEIDPIVQLTPTYIPIPDNFFTTIGQWLFARLQEKGIPIKSLPFSEMTLGAILLNDVAFPTY